MNRLNTTEERIKQTLDTQEFEFNEAHWRAAQELLDKQMPQRKKRRAAFWIIPLLALLGTGIYFGMPHIKEFAGKWMQKPAVVDSAVAEEATDESSGITEENSDITNGITEATTNDAEMAAGEEEEDESYLVMGGPPALQVATMAGGQKRKKNTSTAPSSSQGSSQQEYTPAANDNPVTSETKQNPSKNKPSSSGDKQLTDNPAPKQQKNKPADGGITADKGTTPKDKNTNPGSTGDKNKGTSDPKNNNGKPSDTNGDKGNGNTNKNKNKGDGTGGGAGEDTNEPLWTKETDKPKSTDKPVVPPAKDDEPVKPPVTTKDTKASEPDAKKDVVKTDAPDTTAKAAQSTKDKNDRPVLVKNSVSLFFGGNFARTINPFSPRFSWSPTFGFMYGYYFNPYLQLRAGLNYTYVRAEGLNKSYETSQYSFGHQIQQTTIATTGLHYLDMPVNVGYALSSRFMVLGGATFSYLLNTGNTVTENTISPFGNTTSSTRNAAAYRRGINSWDVQLNLGLEARLAARLRMGALFNAGLLDVTNNTYYNPSTDRNQRFQLYLKYDLLLF